MNVFNTTSLWKLAAYTVIGHCGVVAVAYGLTEAVTRLGSLLQ